MTDLDDAEEAGFRAGYIHCQNTQSLRTDITAIFFLIFGFLLGLLA